jgi:glycolate oxidase iron-sulfur subunit
VTAPDGTAPLGLDADELAACVGCGLCLPHCPTWRVTGDEALSPRGRIGAMRLVEGGEVAIEDASFAHAVETCVQCRGCEPACPSGVPFGHLMEGTRAALAAGPRPVPPVLRAGLWALDRPRLLRAGSVLAAVAQRVRVLRPGLSRRLGLPARLPVRRPRLRSTGAEVVLFTGCVMDAWQRPVHVAAVEVLTAMGVGVEVAGPGAACCGALHAHAGLEHAARRRAETTVSALAGAAPVLVDAAGCGAALAGYGALLGTPEARRFADRVQDVHRWIAEHLDRLPPRRHLGLTVAVQDPCHLRHVQRSHRSVRTVLDGVVDLVELDDEGLCCGAGGSFALVQPGLAADVRARKVAAIARTGAPLVASANPGCALHLAAAGVTVRHPLELLAEAVGPAR